MTTKLKILQREAPVLRKVAHEVPIKNIGSKKIQDIILKMRKAMQAEEDGVAIAAPQIGESLRIFVVSGKALALMDKAKDPEVNELDYEDLVFINPVITRLSRKRQDMEEGCLSVRWLYGKVRRSERASIEALNEKGEKVKRGASGLLAQIFQHEVDHLDGILFIDKAKDLEDLPPKNE